MKLYNIRNPFYSHEGQFEKGKKTLCMGIPLVDIMKHKVYRVTIGSNQATYYDITLEQVQKIAQKFPSSRYINSRRATTIVCPLYAFKKGILEPSTLSSMVDVEQEKARNPEPVQEKLF